MENDQIKSDSAFNKLNYFIGVLMIAIVIFLIAFFVFLYGNNKTASLQQKENRIAAIGNIPAIQSSSVSSF